MANPSSLNGIHGNPDQQVIPFLKARLCVNCENVVETPVCPVCLSKQQIFLSRALGMVHGKNLEEG